MEASSQSLDPPSLTLEELLVRMDHSAVISQLTDLNHLLARIQHAQHGSTAVSSSALDSAASTLSSALSDIATLLQTADSIEQQHHAAESLSEVLDRSISVLESHLEIFERDYSSSDRGRSHTSRVGLRRRYQHSREERRICRSIERITSNITVVSSLLDASTSTPGQEDYGFHNYDRPSRRDPTPPRGRHRDRTTCRGRFLSQDEPGELSACQSFRTELSVSLTAEEEPMVIPANVRGGQVIDESDDEEIHTANVPGRWSPQYSPQGSPPPPYTSRYDRLMDLCYVDDEDTDRDEWNYPSAGIYAQFPDSDETWINPIIAGLKEVIRTNFPAASTSAVDDYTRYRERTLSSPNYKWYLNFRYMSFILQLDLPFQVFLTNLEAYTSGPGLRHCDVLTYLFEDCIVFARSRLCRFLPDPNVSLARNGEDHLPVGVGGGLEVLEEWPIRFKNILSVSKKGLKTLIINISTSTDEGSDEAEEPLGHVRFVLNFETPCQRHGVLKALIPWTMRNDTNDCGYRLDTRTHSLYDSPSEYPSSSSSSSSSSSHEYILHNTIFQSPSHTRPGHRRTTNYIHQSLTFGGPLGGPFREPRNHTAATTPRSTSTQHNSHSSERELRFGINRHRSPSATEFWMTKKRMKRWYRRGMRQGESVVDGQDED